MNNLITRRNGLKGIFGATLALIGVKTNPSSYQKVRWIKLTTEPLGPGDMWASTDPNTPERQAENCYNLQMQAVHPSQYGKLPGTNCGNGAHWRPVAIIQC